MVVEEEERTGRVVGDRRGVAARSEWTRSKRPTGVALQPRLLAPRRRGQFCAF